jgi:TfoX/Sxy family transcriptional regulator of competence genes
MATQKRTVEYLLEQGAGACAVSTKPMFGEYGVYVDCKMIGSICDDQLYVKPTASGRLEPRRVCRRLFGLSHAAIGRCSIMA